MEPFKIATPLKDFTGHYPAPQRVLEVAKTGGEPARMALARLWLSEGIPYAFQGCPAVYEAMRSWMANWLGVHAKEISIVGSGRLGASLAPRKLGAPFCNGSDLDLFVVSSNLLDNLRDEFTAWTYNFENGEELPKNPTEEGFWRDNCARGHNLLQRGFIDQHMIPNRDAYKTTQRISQCMWTLTKKLQLTPGAPQPSKASIRCYSSWEAFVRQTVLNLSQISEHRHE